LESAADVLAGVIQRKQTEQALKESEERFALAIRGTDAGIWDWNLITNEVYFSPRWKSMLGYREDEIANQFSEWEARLHPEDKERAATTISRYLSGELADYELEHRLRHKDGSYRWILARGAAVRDSLGRPYRMVGSHLDITERKAMETSYRAQEAQLIAATTIQEHIWPEQPPQLPGYDIAAKVFPAEFAAGDHFDYFTLDDGSLVFLVADVAGHGFSSALLMASTHAYIRSLFSSGLEMDAVLEHANSELMRDTDLFVSIILGRLQPDSGRFTYINAGHPSGYLFDKSGQIKHELKSSVPPLAILSDTKFVQSDPVVMNPGDTLLLTTDGVMEACSPQQELFGTQRMLEVTRAHLQEPAEKIIAALHERVSNFSGGSGSQDDLTALVIRAEDH
jgi:PAS domain S-box-containing protein